MKRKLLSPTELKQLHAQQEEQKKLLAAKLEQKKLEEEKANKKLVPPKQLLNPVVEEEVVEIKEEVEPPKPQKKPIQVLHERVEELAASIQKPKYYDAEIARIEELLESKVNQEDYDLTPLYIEIQELKGELLSLPEVHYYDEEISNLQNELNELEIKYYDDEISVLQERINSIIIPEVKYYDKDIHDLHERIDLFKISNSNIVDKQEKELKDLKTFTGNLADNLNQLVIPEEFDPSQLETHISSLQESLVDIRNEISNLPEVKYYENELNSLTEMITNVRDCIPVIPEIKYYDDELNGLLSTIEEVRHSIPELPEVRYYENEIAALEKQIQEVENKIPELPEIKSYDNDIVVLENNVVEIKKSLFELQKSFSEIKIPEIPEQVDWNEDIQKIYEEIKNLKEVPVVEESTDPLVPLDQKFATLDDLQNHYRIFINRIQQQLASLGGGGEVRLNRLDDVSFDNTVGSLLIYDGSKWTGISSSSIGGGGGGGGTANYADVAGIATYAITAGIATYSNTSGVSTYASTAGIATYAASSGIATYASRAGIATYANTSGIATYASLSGLSTYASTAGIASNSTLLDNQLPSYYLDYNNFTNTPTNLSDFTNNVGFITSSALVGYATETYVNVAIANLIDSSPATLDTLNELAQALGDDPNFSVTITNSLANKLSLTGGVVSGIITASGFVGDLTGTASNATYAVNSGIASYASTAGIATYANVSGISTYATIAGIATYATSSGLSTYASTAGIATYADVAGIATYSSSSGISSYADVAGIATYASVSGIATVAEGLTGTPDINVGLTTASRLIVGSGTTFTEDFVVEGNARVVGILTVGSSSIIIDGSENQVNVGTGVTIHHTNGVQVGSNTVHSNGLTINRISVSGIATASSFIPTSGYIKAADGTNSFYIYSGTGNVSFQGTIGASQINSASGYKALDFGTTATPSVNIANNLIVGAGASIVGVVTASSFVGNITGTASNATYAVTAGVATYSNVAGIATYATSSGIATYADVSGISTYASSAGIATYSNTSGIATYSSSAGIATYATTAGVSTNSTLLDNQLPSYYLDYTNFTNTPSNLSDFTNDVGFITSSALVGYATETYVNVAVANLVNSAPATLDTLKELADALGSDPNFSVTITNSLANKLSLSGGIVSGIITASGFVGNLTGTATTATYAVNSGVATYASTAGIATVAQGLTGTPDINVGLTTATRLVVGSGTTFPEDLVVEGNTRITGILTVGTSSIVLDGEENQVNVGSGVTLHHTNGVQVGGNTLHTSGLTLNHVNLSGITTLGTVKISSGIITATSTSGIVTYYGDGQYLQNILSGVGVATAGGLVGTGATILDFRGAGISTVTVSSGIATINIVGGGSGGGAVSIGTIAPPTPSNGDLWYSPDYGRTFVWYDETALGVGSTAVWVDAAPFNYFKDNELTPAKTSNSIVATTNQETFSVSYKVGYVDVYLNGVRLSDSEFVANNGSSITLIQPAASGDVLDVVEYTMGIGATGATGPQGPQGPLSQVIGITSSIVHYPLIVSGSGTVTASITTTSNYFSFTPSSGTLSVNQLSVVGVVTATDFNSTSDINLKENVKIIDNALDKVNSISGITFNWIENKKSSAGVIAQEVEKILPEIVQESEGNKTVNYNGLIGLLVEAIKEQQEEINSLKARLDRLEE